MVRVYTNRKSLGPGEFSLGRGSAIWNDNVPDLAALFDPQGVEESRASYPPACQ